MDWASELTDVVERYAGGGGAAPAPADPGQDYQRVANAAPPAAVADGIQQALSSDATPPFPQMVSQLFANSNPAQKTGLLNQLLSSVSPGILSKVLGGGVLSGPPGGQAVSEQQVAQVSPEQVQQLASHAEQQDPSIVQRVSGFYAQHPEVVQALGGLALSIAVQHMLKHRA